MSHDRDFDYRISAGQLQASLRHADEDFAHDQPAADEDILGDHLAELSEANHAFLRELDDDQAAPADSTTGNQAEAIVVTRPLPSNAPVEPSDTLTDDELEVVAELEAKEQRVAVVYIEPAPPSKFDGPKVTTPEGSLARLRKQTDMLRRHMDERERKKDAAKDHWSRLHDEAKARIDAPKRKAKADARAARDVARKRDERACQITPKRTAALEAANENEGGKFYVKLAKLGAQEYAQFREALTEARRVHGAGVSMSRIAAIWSAMTGVKKTKPMVQNRLEVVDKLEAKGMPWYRWRES
jgi:hypothetical protein